MIEIRKIQSLLLLVYYSDFRSSDWLEEKLESQKEITIKGVFFFDKSKFYKKNEDPYGYEEPEYLFVIGKLQGDYYKIDNSVFNLKNDFFLHESIDWNEKHFYSKDKISVLKQIDNNITGDVFIGGDKEDILPYEEFQKLIEIFPTTHEIKLYRNARVTSIISNYFEGVKDAESGYQNYLNKKTGRQNNNIRRTFKDSEILKFESLSDKLRSMLTNEITYSEHHWQNEIIQIIQLLFPKYVAAIKELRFNDIYNNKSRRLDFGLVDFMGNFDIAEIKIPFEKSIVSKSKYRENHIPNRDLSGAIMQIEKYIFYLNKTGLTGERKLTEKYKEKLPEGLEIKITNPKGIIIMGRDKDLDEAQLNDFEIIKRKYKNVIDIFTYDDLIRRLDMIIKQLKMI